MRRLEKTKKNIYLIDVIMDMNYLLKMMNGTFNPELVTYIQWMYYVNICM